MNSADSMDQNWVVSWEVTKAGTSAVTMVDLSAMNSADWKGKLWAVWSDVQKVEYLEKQTVGTTVARSVEKLELALHHIINKQHH